MREFKTVKLAYFLFFASIRRCNIMRLARLSSFHFRELLLDFVAKVLAQSVDDV
jgi:hypothetical protein